MSSVHLHADTWHSVVVTYEVAVEHGDGQQAAVISEAHTLDEVPGFLQSAYAELFAVLAEQGKAPIGPPFARYRVEEGTFHVTAGVPVDGSIAPRGRVGSGELPAGDVASTVHVGSYERLPDAFHAVTDWVAVHGRVIAGDPWESYLDGPEVSNPRTKVCFPVRRVDGDPV